VEDPLRVLVVIANADGLAPVDVRQEWINLIDTIDYLGMDDRLSVERLEKPTLFELQRRLRQRPYHILHVIGHAVYNEAAQDGRLVLEDEVGRGRMMSGQHLGQFLRDHYATRLVILQSCDRALDRHNPLGLVAQNIVQRGVPAAVVLPYELPDSLSLAFLHDLYANIAEMKPVDLAMVEARKALASEAPNVLWGLPWLLVRTTSGYIFDDGRFQTQAKLVNTPREPSLLERVMRSNASDDF
jgi:CHAT domain-containing protein